MPSIKPKTDARRLDVLEQSLSHHSSLLSGLRNEINWLRLRDRQHMEALDAANAQLVLAENAIMNLGAKLVGG